MGLGVRVNGVSDRSAEGPGTRGLDAEGMLWPSVNLHGQRQIRPIPISRPAAGAAVGPRTKPTRSSIRPVESDQGPCLYFGPAGQRCDRRATHNGFCRSHQPGESSAAAAPFLTPKKIVAFALALAMFWPELARIVAALVRLFH